MMLTFSPLELLEHVSNIFIDGAIKDTLHIVQKLGVLDNFLTLKLFFFILNFSEEKNLGTRPFRKNS